MPTAGHMTIKAVKQGPLEGDCPIKGREKSILIYKLEHEVGIPRDPTTGMPTGKRVHMPLTVTTHIGKYTPKIFQACCQGEKLTEVILDLWRTNTQTGQEENYYRVKLVNAIVVGTKEWFPNTLQKETESYRHMQDVSFSYEEIHWTAVVDSVETQDMWTAA